MEYFKLKWKKYIEFIIYWMRRYRISKFWLAILLTWFFLTGLYRCEISGEAPLFQTASREAVLAVVGKSLWPQRLSKRQRRQIMERKLFFFFLTSNTFEAGAFTWWLRRPAFWEEKNQLINERDFLFCFQIYRTKVLSLPEASHAITSGIKWRSIVRRKKANRRQSWNGND